MKKRGVFVVTISLVLTLISLTHAASYGGGSGTPEDPYQIWTPAQMNTIGLNSGDWDKCFKLMDDIDMLAYTGTSYNIIGNAATPFSGIFDGNRYAIKFLTYTVYDIVDYIGLFGCTDSFAVIKNLSVDANLLTGGHHVGSLVGKNGGTLISCCANGSSIHGSGYVGGLVGENTGTVMSCWAGGQIWAGSLVGGLVGENSGTVTSCYADGYVGNDGYPGGLVGRNSGMVNFCYASVNIESAGSPGGLVGEHASGTINACFWNTDSGGPYPGVGLGDSDGVAGLTSYEMHTLWLFTVVGWDFTNETANGTNDTWRMCEDSMDYPKLNWQFSDGDFACPDGVNTEDLNYFVGLWMMENCTTDNNYCGWADIDHSGSVDLADYAILAGHWLGVV